MTIEQKLHEMGFTTLENVVNWKRTQDDERMQKTTRAWEMYFAHFYPDYTFIPMEDVRNVSYIELSNYGPLPLHLQEQLVNFRIYDKDIRYHDDFFAWGPTPEQLIEQLRHNVAYLEMGGHFNSPARYPRVRYDKAPQLVQPVYCGFLTIGPNQLYL